MDRYKNSIQMGYQCKNPFVCCLFVYLHFRQSLISVAVCGFKYRLERGKVFGVNTLQGRKIHPETACRPTFQLSNEVCTSFADEAPKYRHDRHISSRFRLFKCQADRASIVCALTLIADSIVIIKAVSAHIQLSSQDICLDFHVRQQSQQLRWCSTPCRAS